MILRNVLSHFFTLKFFSKSRLVRILKRDNQLNFFRSLKKRSKHLTKCEGAIEFLRLCLKFGVTSTFPEVERSKAHKWRKSSENYQMATMDEELRSKLTQLKHLRSRRSPKRLQGCQGGMLLAPLCHHASCGR